MARALSTEDGNLAYSIISTRTQSYRDIDLSFSKTPTGDIYKKIDAQAVRQAVKNLLLTNYFEKPFMPFYGGNLRALLFELSTTADPIDIRDQIVRAIESYEPRAKVIDLSATQENHDLNITIEFQIVNTTETVTFTTSLSRLR